MLFASPFTLIFIQIKRATLLADGWSAKNIVSRFRFIMEGTQDLVFNQSMGGSHGVNDFRAGCLEGILCICASG